MRKREHTKEAARRILWSTRETNLPHLLEHRCGVTDVVVDMCVAAGWTFDSYLLATLFNVEDLLVEGTK